MSSLLFRIIFMYYVGRVGRRFFYVLEIGHLVGSGHPYYLSGGLMTI